MCGTWGYFRQGIVNCQDRLFARRKLVCNIYVIIIKNQQLMRHLKDYACLQYYFQNGSCFNFCFMYVNDASGKEGFSYCHDTRLPFGMYWVKFWYIDGLIPFQTHCAQFIKLPPNKLSLSSRIVFVSLSQFFRAKQVRMSELTSTGVKP